MKRYPVSDKYDSVLKDCYKQFENFHRIITTIKMSGIIPDNSGMKTDLEVHYLTGLTVLLQCTLIIVCGTLFRVHWRVNLKFCLY